MLGGDASFYQREMLDEVFYNAELNANVGFLWHDHIASGLRPFFDFNTNDYTAGAVVFTRGYYYFKTCAPFVEVNAGYSYREVLWTDGAVNSIVESTIIGGRAGVAFFISPKITFESFFFYDHNISRNYPQTEGIKNTESKDKSLGLGLGFQFYL